MAMPVVKTLVARWDVYGINRHAGISRTARASDGWEVPSRLGPIFYQGLVELQVP